MKCLGKSFYVTGLAGLFASTLLVNRMAQLLVAPIRYEIEKMIFERLLGNIEGGNIKLHLDTLCLGYGTSGAVKFVPSPLF